MLSTAFYQTKDLVKKKVAKAVDIVRLNVTPQLNNDSGVLQIPALYSNALHFRYRQQLC